MNLHFRVFLNMASKDIHSLSFNQRECESAILIPSNREKTSDNGGSSSAINRDCSRKLDNTVKSNARVNSASQGLLGCCLLWLAASRNTSGVRLWQAITGVARQLIIHVDKKG